MRNYIYLRVSKEDETLQDLERHREKIIEKFNPVDPIIFKERGSAYNLDKIHKRKEFIKLINIVYNSENTTELDLFLGNQLQNKEEVNIYVWDFARIMRNFRLNMLFAVLKDMHNVNIHSYKEGSYNMVVGEIPSNTFSRYMMQSIHSFSAHDYSWQTSQNIKKAVKKSGDITIGTKNNIIKTWGRSFTNTKGERIKLSPEESQEIYSKVKSMIKGFEKRKIRVYQSNIKQVISKEFGIDISNSYITSVKNKEIKHK